MRPPIILELATDGGLVEGALGLDASTAGPVVEFDRLTGTIIHEWRPRRIGYDSLRAWGHANAVLHHPPDDSFIVSVRHQDAVVKFSRSTGELRWILGPHANWNEQFQPFLLTPAGTPFTWAYHQHAPMVTSRGTVLLFDNGNHRASPPDEPLPPEQSYSRAVEVTRESPARRSSSSSSTTRPTESGGTSTVVSEFRACTAAIEGLAMPGASRYSPARGHSELPSTSR